MLSQTICLDTCGALVEELKNGSWKCLICCDILSRKQRIVSHLQQLHSITGVTKEKHYKLYVSDPEIEVPPRTLRRKRRHSSEGSSQVEDIPLGALPLSVPGPMDDHIDQIISIPTINSQQSHDEDVIIQEESVQFDDMNSDESPPDTPSESTDSEASLSEFSEFDDAPLVAHVEPDISLITSINSENKTDSEVYQADVPNSENEKYLTVQSFILRHKLNSSAQSDLLKLYNILHASDATLNISEMKQAVGEIPVKYYDTCEICGALFPEDSSVYQCPTTSCISLRYKGEERDQSKNIRKCFYATIPLKHQLSELLSRPGIWKCATERPTASPDIISDITSSRGYKTAVDSLKDGVKCDEHIRHIFTFCYNTDGALLYKSTNVNIWPIFMVVNELPPKLRFSRKNMLLWGLWQGHGKPTFGTYFTPFVKDMNMLRNEDFTVIVNGTHNKCRGILLLGTADLQAKAPLLCITHHNGEYGCITCEIAGQTVKTHAIVGKRAGTVRYYQYEDSPVIRTTESIVEIGTKRVQAGDINVPNSKLDNMKKKKYKGIQNVSPLLGMSWFDIVWGSVPDYMHGILLGVTKKLCTMWFDKKYKKEEFSMYNDIGRIDGRLLAMKPVDIISRLPRSISKNLAHWKATEFEIWLLYYSLPCIIDILPEKYLINYAKFVSAIYCLLGDNIPLAAIETARQNLKLFYKDFSELYGCKNCGLNIHNAGQHLADYVLQWGPIWAWSCFAYEDMNGNVLDNVHGSGNISIQALDMIQTQKVVQRQLNQIGNEQMRSFAYNMMDTSKIPRKLKSLKDCNAAGALHNHVVTSQAILMKLKNILDCEFTAVDFWKIFRVVVDGQVYFSREYSRVHKKISYCVLIENIEPVIAFIEYFLVHKQTQTCIAVTDVLSLDIADTFMFKDVTHIIQVTINDVEKQLSLFNVKNITEKLMFLNGNKDHICVTRMPNLHRLSH